MTQYTPNYKLDLYEDSDKPNLRGQYNSAMMEIDKQLFKNANDVISINNLIAGINQSIGTIKVDIDTLQSDVSSQGSRITVLETGQENLTVKVSTAQSDIALLQGDVVNVQTDIASLQTGVNTANQNATSAKETAQSAESKATSAQQESATQSGYWNALGIDSLDDAVDFKNNYDDYYMTTMENQADVRKLGNDAKANEVGNWEVIDSPSPRSPQVYSNTLKVFVNPSSTLIKICGLFRATGTQINNLIVNIPKGSSQNVLKGIPLGVTLNGLEDMSDYIVYTSSGLYMLCDNQYGANASVTFPKDLVIGTDKNLYLPFDTTSSSEASKYFLIYFFQPILTTNNYHLTPTEPDVPSE